MVGFYQALGKVRGITSVIALFVIVFFSCSSDEGLQNVDIGLDYYPLEVNSYRIYQVEGTEYFSYNDSLIINYELRETVTESFENLEGGTSYKITIEKRMPESENWILDSIWTARKDEYRAILVSNNVPVISLTFPIEEGKSWDSNGLNSEAPKEFTMVNAREPFEGRYDVYDQSVTVIQDDLPDEIVNFRSKKEVFSKGLGLVYRENIFLNFRQGDFLGLGVVETGIRYQQSLKEFGKN